jgi:hypothetical protein
MPQWPVPQWLSLLGRRLSQAEPNRWQQLAMRHQEILDGASANYLYQVDRLVARLVFGQRGSDGLSKAWRWV